MLQFDFLLLISTEGLGFWSRVFSIFSGLTLFVCVTVCILNRSHVVDLKTPTWCLGQVLFGYNSNKKYLDTCK